MTITYGLIARGTVPLVEYNTGQSGANAASIARRILAKIPGGEHKKSYAYEGAYFHYHIDNNGIVVLMMSDDADKAGTRLSFSCIQDVRSNFYGVCGSLWPNAREGSLNSSFSRTLRDRMDFYSNDPEADSIRKARSQVSEVKDIMINNVEKVLERGDRIETLVEKTDLLQENSEQFRDSSVKLKRQMWWKNTKMCIIIWAVVIIVILVIVLIILGKTGVI
eukprot:CAMPEP_0201552898 /NCGR_PEP_ID=MMETSP0173_2-20130828/19186_1 /ASSEMBLY_ACC=CAM_ASM_000268 /TAXON_ID=218659 /ORGANISM="Vexillifera sp., Strain DIVA3 564/2" /LENGTH=220 /DNA_ID=CAMNT_0047963483 /DNA_START=49 /DNA_END=711 /DNA_ORIENTATION=+